MTDDIIKKIDSLVYDNYDFIFNVQKILLELLNTDKTKEIDDLMRYFAFDDRIHLLLCFLTITKFADKSCYKHRDGIIKRAKELIVKEEGVDKANSVIEGFV